MKRWIVLLLAVMLSLSAFWAAGCGAQEEGTLLSSFESYDELINMRWLNDFGSAKLTTDERYVTDGAYAVHLTVNGDYKTNRNPAMGLVLGTRYEKTDYSDVDKISVDVYNDNDFTANIYFQYLTKSKDTPMLSSENKAELPPKTMTKAVFEIDRDFLSQLLNIDQVLQVRLVFDRADSYMQPYRSFYVDNLRYHTTNDPIDESYQIRRADEIESADPAGVSLRMAEHQPVPVHAVQFGIQHRSRIYQGRSGFFQDEQYHRVFYDADLRRRLEDRSLYYRYQRVQEPLVLDLQPGRSGRQRADGERRPVRAGLRRPGEGQSMDGDCDPHRDLPGKQIRSQKIRILPRGGRLSVRYALQHLFR